jgi:hypothetical protein
MPIYLDDQLLPSDSLAPDATIAQVLDVARDRAALAGTLILGLRCDDAPVPAEQLERLLTQRADGFRRIDLLTGHPKELVLEALEQTQAAFAQTFALVKRTSNDISAGRIGEAMRSLSDCISAWCSAHQAVAQSADLLHVNFEQLQFDGQPVSPWLERLTARLGDLKTAIEARDHVQLGDILRYEMDETLREWEQMLEAFIRHVRCMDAPPLAAPPPRPDESPLRPVPCIHALSGGHAANVP